MPRRKRTKFGKIIASSNKLKIVLTLMNYNKFKSYFTKSSIG